MPYPIFSKKEINLFKTSCAAAGQTFNIIKKIIRPGWTEKQIAYQINKTMKFCGSQSLAFRTIVASGPNSSIPHHKTTNRKIKTNDIVLLDFGCKYNGFCSDISRTIFIGSPKPEWLKVHKIIQTAQQKVFTHRVWFTQDTPVKASFVDGIARNFISKKGFGKNFIHGLGHGIGTKVHQYFKISPKSKTILKPGMVFTIEPGIYIKGKFGIRIEDTVYLSKTGLEILTKTVIIKSYANLSSLA